MQKNIDKKVSRIPAKLSKPSEMILEKFLLMQKPLIKKVTNAT
jgi:hypothetical protein